MEKLSKGQITRNAIVENARSIFNDKGLDITLDRIVQEMGLSKGRITNHFSTKESLFQAIMGFYEWQLGEYIRHFNWADREVNLQSTTIYTSGVMDIQYENRCAIGYLAMVTREKKEMFDYIQKSYKYRVASIRERVAMMVKAGILESNILQNRSFSVFQFHYTNLLSNWVVSEQHYHGEMTYPALKPVYLQGILQCYYPYLTPTGLEEFKNLNFSKLSKMS